MRFTDMADEMFGAAQGALPAGVRLATAKRGGVTITRASGGAEPGVWTDFKKNRLDQRR